MTVHVFGVRHHGPGSARSLRQALEALRPDVVLVEGPPDADEALALAAHEGMRPPVALLVYAPDEPRRAAYYPFAEFSPEWVAIRHALAAGVPVRFMDLPMAHQLGLALEAERQREGGGGMGDEQPSQATPPEAVHPPSPLPRPIRSDPLQAIAEAAGYAEGERWWDHMVEERRDAAGVFDAVLEVMTALREADAAADAAADAEAADPNAGAAGDDGGDEGDRYEARREAWMRQTIRRALRDGHERVAVVCGAWHAPALAEEGVRSRETKARDTELLAGLPKAKVQATWVPWSHGRLCRESGYGAGVASPGWYRHLWDVGHDRGSEVAITWLARVARLLREKDLDASPASVIESVRLAEALAALRGRAMPGLDELTEATRSVLLGGDATALALVRDKLIVGELLGEVPEDAPVVPLQAALAREQKRLRLPPEAGQRVLELDLRKPLDLDRSLLLHRLNVLGVPWGAGERARGKGTFKEVWRLQWQPEFALRVIEAAPWGNTVPDAAAGRARASADEAQDLPALCVLLDRILLADLPEATAHLLARLDAMAAVATDVAHLCDALPPLASVLRYGDVRGTDLEAVGRLVGGLVARVAAGLPAACASLDDAAAAAMFRRISGVHDAVALGQDADRAALWQGAL
ncbi:MAG TPA: DUF5682 family protein, partial [Gemmatimonadaceae bacterium]|nr:DUF5682 family protein [Gemmatimonadaceae bacterium]